MSGIHSHPNREQVCLPLIRCIALLAHFVIRPDLDLRYHNTHDPADVRITFVIGLKDHIGLALRTARPPDLKAAALKDRTLDWKMPAHVGLLGLNGTTVLVWKLELPLNQ
jgi:hypothetical protein